MTRLLLRGFFVFLLFAVQAGSARAIEQQVLDDLLTAYQSRPGAASSVRAADVRENLEKYFEANLPADASIKDSAVAAFVANLKLALADPGHSGVEEAGRATTVFNRILFYTLADDGLIAAASQNGRGELFWQRSREEPRTAADANALRDIAKAFGRFQTFNKDETERPLESLFDGINSAPKSEALDQLRQRLATLYGNEGFPVTPELLADIAAVQFLLGADRTDSMNREWAAALAPLAQALARSASSSQTLDARMVAALERREREEGFRSTVPVATGFLKQSDFVQLVAAGYLVDDIGAGKAHGAFAHRIQWRAIMDHANSNQAAFNHTVLELYTSIGRLDAAIVAKNKTLFGLERRQLIWDRVFDLPPSTGEDLSHPEEMRTGLSGAKSELEKLDAALAEEFSSRFRRENELAAEARKRGELPNPAKLYIDEQVPAARSQAASFGGRAISNLRVRGLNPMDAKLSKDRDEAEIKRQRGKRQPALSASTSNQATANDDDDNDSHNEAALDKRPERKPPAEERAKASTESGSELPPGTDSGTEIDFTQFEEYDNAALADSDNEKDAGVSDEKESGNQDSESNKNEEREAAPAEEAD